ncbi:MAG TPA: DNA polymerase Y family protein [Chitinophagaceae bacterium]
MQKRYVAIWFRYLMTDWFTIRQPVLHGIPFVLAAPDHGRMVVTAANIFAKAEGIDNGIAVADARAINHSLQVLNDKPQHPAKLLKGIAEWCVRYTPVVALDLPDGLILDATGCAHLWGSEEAYVSDIKTRLKSLGYNVRVSMADTIGTAWAISRYGLESPIIKNDEQRNALLSLTPAALRLETETVVRLQKLGLRRINDFINMPRSALRRRFGQHLIKRLDQALGDEEEFLQPEQPIEAYIERLPCLEPIVTATGIEIALKQLLETMCHRLKHEGKGLRIAVFKGFRVDGKIEKIEIGTNRGTHNASHIFKLFEVKLCDIEPALGIELFILEADKVEDVSAVQEKLWESGSGLNDVALSELLDRMVCKFGPDHIHRYIPDEHYWPERSMKPATSIHEKLNSTWKVDRPRPLQVLPKPEPIQVTAPIPDYPPMLFRYKGKLHKIVKADGPERIEQEWWMQQGQHRDYYYVEAEDGLRYWLFRSGHYSEDRSYQWFIHGFFS